MLAAYSMIRLTSASGRKLNRKTPRPATLESVENAITDMPRARVLCAVAGTDSANSGPRMISAPSSSACWVPCWAPCGLPPSSLIRSWMLGFWNSASAISAAFFIDCAATPALPAADSGRINPTLTCPVPTASGCWVGPAGPASGCELLNGLENELRLCCTLAQAPSRGAPRIRPTAVLRVAPEGWDLGLSGPAIASLPLTDRHRPGRPPPGDQAWWIQAYCRRIVNQNKRIRAHWRGRGCRSRFPLPLCGPAIRRPQATWRNRHVPSRLRLCAQNLSP